MQGCKARRGNSLRLSPSQDRSGYTKSQRDSVASLVSSCGNNLDQVCSYGALKELVREASLLSVVKIRTRFRGILIWRTITLNPVTDSLSRAVPNEVLCLTPFFNAVSLNLFDSIIRLSAASHPPRRSITFYKIFSNRSVRTVYGGVCQCY